MTEKRVYTFGNGVAEGKADMKNLLGGKGANLAEMNLIGVPVPPGFTITTDVCNEYFEKGKDKVVALLKGEVEKAVQHIEKLMNSKFGDLTNPLLVSVRSGARASMPGMMDTILNLGLNDAVVEGLAAKSGNERFAYDSYRRFVQMYGDVVLGMKPTNKEDIDPFEAIIQQVKAERGIKLDNEMSVDELRKLVSLFKSAIKKQTGKDFPTDPMAIWVTPRQRVFASVVMPQQAKISSTANTLSTHKAKTWWPEYARPSKSPKRVRCAGLSNSASKRKCAPVNILQWKRICLRFSHS